MKKYVFLLLPFLLISCHNKKVCRDYVSLLDVEQYGYLVSKSSLICLTDNQMEEKLINRYGSFLLDSFVCYTVHNPMKTTLGKMVQPSKYPEYILLEKDSIVSYFCGEDLENILDRFDAEQLKNEFSYLKSRNKEADYLNILLKLYKYLNKPNNTFMVELNLLDSIIGKHNKFFGKYLLAQFYENIDIDKADSMYHSLWLNSTLGEMKSYPEEFIDIMKSKDNLVLINKGDIEFDYTEYDFGTMKSYEEVACKFYYTNNSNKKFVIHNVTTTCGCTVSSWNKQPIKSFARDSILVKFKTNHKGRHQKTIIIEANCREKIELGIQAEVF